MSKTIRAERDLEARRYKQRTSKQRARRNANELRQARKDVGLWAAYQNEGQK